MAASKGKPSVSRDDADRVVEKLQALRQELSPSEQLVLDNIIQVFEQRVIDAQAQDLLKDFPDAPELLDEVSGFMIESDETNVTWTTVTITTTAASHPWITCAAGGGGTYLR